MRLQTVGAAGDLRHILGGWNADGRKTHRLLALDSAMFEAEPVSPNPA